MSKECITSKDHIYLPIVSQNQFFHQLKINTAAKQGVYDHKMLSRAIFCGFQCEWEM